MDVGIGKQLGGAIPEEFVGGSWAFGHTPSVSGAIDPGTTNVRSDKGDFGRCVPAGAVGPVRSSRYREPVRFDQ